MIVSARIRNPDGMRGFTLVELLVALTIMGLLTVMVFGLLRTTTQAWDGSTTRAEQVADMQAARQLARSRLTGAMPVRVPEEMSPRHRDSLLFSGNSRFVRFVGLLPAHRGLPGPQVYELELLGDALVLRFQPWHPRMSGFSAGPWEERIIVDGIRDMEIRYLGRRRDGESVGWHSTWGEDDTLPSLVRIRVDRAADHRLRWPELAVAIRNREAGGSGGSGVGFGASR